MSTERARGSGDRTETRHCESPGLTRHRVAFAFTALLIRRRRDEEAIGDEWHTRNILNTAGFLAFCVAGSERDMADARAMVGGQDRVRINLNEDYEVADWTRVLGVTRQRLPEAVAAVGRSRGRRARPAETRPALI